MTFKNEKINFSKCERIHAVIIPAEINADIGFSIISLEFYYKQYSQETAKNTWADVRLTYGAIVPVA